MKIKEKMKQIVAVLICILLGLLLTIECYKLYLTLKEVANTKKKAESTSQFKSADLVEAKKLLDQLRVNYGPDSIGKLDRKDMPKNEFKACLEKFGVIIPSTMISINENTNPSDFNITEEEFETGKIVFVNASNDKFAPGGAGINGGLTALMRKNKGITLDETTNEEVWTNLENLYDDKKNLRNIGSVRKSLSDKNYAIIHGVGMMAGIIPRYGIMNAAGLVKFSRKLYSKIIKECKKLDPICIVMTLLSTQLYAGSGTFLVC